jgi:hypothetical protein
MQARKGPLQGTKKPVPHYGSHQPEPTTTSPAHLAICHLPASQSHGSTQPTAHFTAHKNRKNLGPVPLSFSRDLLETSTRPGSGWLPNPKSSRCWNPSPGGGSVLACCWLAPRRGCCLAGWLHDGVCCWLAASLLLAGWGQSATAPETEGHGWVPGVRGATLGDELAWLAVVVPSTALHGWPRGRWPAPDGCATGLIIMCFGPDYYFWAVFCISGFIMLFGLFYFRVARIQPGTFR